MKTLRKYTIFLISSLALLLFTNKANACAYSEYGEDLRISMFRIMSGYMKAYSPFQYTAHIFYSTGNDGSFDRARHTREWAAALNYKGRLEDLELVVFKTPPELFYAMCERGKLQEFFKGNEFIKVLIKPGNENFLHYLEIAKAIEYWESGIIDPWNGYNTEKMKMTDPLKTLIIDDLNQKLKTEKNPFLSKRMAYQLVRMYFQIDDFEELRNTFQRYFDINDTSSVINPWAMHYYAIAEGISGDSIRANYLKSLVFARCDDKKYRMYTTFLKSDYMMRETMKEAKTDEEKSTILAMSIINNPGRTLPVLLKLEELKAPSDLMQFLVLREINKLEDWLLTTELTVSGPAVSNWEDWTDSENYMKKNYQSDKTYLANFITFVKHLRQNAAAQSARWYSLALAHLLVMNDQNDEALLVMPAEDQVNDPALKRQVIIEKLFLYSSSQYIAQSDKRVLSAGLFNRLDSAVAEGNENPMTLYSLCQRFSKAMQKQNDIARATLFLGKAECYKYNSFYWSDRKDNGKRHIASEFNYYLCNKIDQSGTSDDVEQLSGIMYNSSPQALDEYICRQELPSKDQVTELKGSKLFREGHLKEALAVWEKLPGNYWTANGSFDDYLGYDIRQPKELYPEVKEHKRKANKVSVLSQIINLEDSVLGSGSRKYEQMLKLAHAWYNVSYYGHSWILAHYYKSCEPEAEILNDAYPGLPSHILDDQANYIKNLRAKQLYNKVYLESPDAEQRCEAMTMLQYLSYVDFYNETSYQDLEKKKFRSPFSVKTWSKYSKTRFYQNMSMTCPLFSSFVSR